MIVMNDDFDKCLLSYESNDWWFWWLFTSNTVYTLIVLILRNDDFNTYLLTKEVSKDWFLLVTDVFHDQ